MAVSGVLTFAFIAALILVILPSPHKQGDYIVAGAVATLAAMGVLFASILTDPRARDLLFKSKDKD